MRFLLPIIFLLFSYSSSAQLMRKLLKKPSVATLQYAGSIGTLNLSAGHTFSAYHQEVSLGYGYVPKVLGGELHILTLKYSKQFLPLSLPENIRLFPLQASAFAAYYAGRDFYVYLPRNKYPANYYWWPSGLRLHLALGSQLEKRILINNRERRLALYYEINTNDLYLFSYFSNREYLELEDILKLGIGVKYYMQ